MGDIWNVTELLPSFEQFDLYVTTQIKVNAKKIKGINKNEVCNFSSAYFCPLIILPLGQTGSLRIALGYFASQ